MSSDSGPYEVKRTPQNRGASANFKNKSQKIVSFPALRPAPIARFSPPRSSSHNSSSNVLQLPQRNGSAGSPASRAEQIQSAPILNPEHLLQAPPRMFDCANYNTCLGLAAALNWNSFSCEGCSGKVNSQLLWKAHSSLRNDKALSRLLGLPPPSAHEELPSKPEKVAQAATGNFRFPIIP